LIGRKFQADGFGWLSAVQLPGQAGIVTIEVDAGSVKKDCRNLQVKIK